MTIIDRLIPKGKYNRPGKASAPKKICVHYTGEAGASAGRLALFFTANPNAETSSQYIVGMEGELIKLDYLSRIITVLKCGLNDILIFEDIDSK